MASRVQLLFDDGSDMHLDPPDSNCHGGAAAMSQQLVYSMRQHVA
jgi:hypothetical protein